MKQNISIEDLLELTVKQKDKLFDLVSVNQFDRIYDFKYKQSGFIIEIENYDCSTVIHAVWDDGSMSDFMYGKSVVILLSIGQMIEILEKQTKYAQQIINEGGRYSVGYNLLGLNTTGWQSEYYNELCDALWKAVLSIL